MDIYSWRYYYWSYLICFLQCFLRGPLSLGFFYVYIEKKQRKQNSKKLRKKSNDILFYYIYGTRDKQQQNKEENVHRFAIIEREIIDTHLFVKWNGQIKLGRFRQRWLHYDMTWKRLSKVNSRIYRVCPKANQKGASHNKI